jgi:predicted HicB family RNase H-like nuclease
MRTPKPSSTRSIRLPVTVWAIAQAEAARRGITINRLIRQMLEQVGSDGRN